MIRIPLASCRSSFGYGYRYRCRPNVLQNMGQQLFSSSSVHVERHQHSSSNLKRSRIPEDGLTLDDFVGGKNNNEIDHLYVHDDHSTNNTGIPRATFHIKTYGCQMNVNDTDIVRAVLLKGGFEEAANEEEASIWLTNTCAIREKAEQKVWQRLRTQKKRKQMITPRTASTSTVAGSMHTTNESLQYQQSLSSQQQNRIVGVLGCMAERLQERLLDEQVADLVVGPDAYRDLPRLLEDLLEPEDPTITSAMNVQLSLDETYQDIVPVRNTDMPYSAFVSIQRGCSNRCSFCIVPFTRGQERSRPLESIVAEVTQLIEEDNLKEVVLLGQNVNSYHDRSEEALAARPLASLPGLSNDGFRNRIRRPTHGGYTFVDLVEHISDIDPELRVRFTSPHPKDYPTDLLHLMAERPNVCKQLHMPAQSGSTSMLKRMKRGYSREAYLELIESVHSIIPDVALSSDFIAGFCGETDEEHRDTVTLLETVEYEQAFLFAYSLREKTHAHRALDDNVPSDVKQARLQELIDTFRTRVHAKNERVEVGKLRLVLLEGPAKRQQGPDVMWHGRTDQNKRILFPVPTSKDGNAIAVEEKFANEVMLREITTGKELTTTPIAAGDYAVVEVTEAKGHTLRGRLLWKTTLANHSKAEAGILSNLPQDQLLQFKKHLII